MKSRQVAGGYLLVFKPGERLVEGIKQFCQERIIRAAWVSGLGAVSQAEIGFYNLDDQEYLFERYENDLEVVSMTGNVSVFRNETFLHIHTVLSDKAMKVFGGHLKEATVGGTMEVMLRVLESSLVREVDENTGLKTLG